MCIITGVLLPWQRVFSMKVPAESHSEMVFYVSCKFRLYIVKNKATGISRMQ